MRWVLFTALLWAAVPAQCSEEVVRGLEDTCRCFMENGKAQHEIAILDMHALYDHTVDACDNDSEHARAECQVQARVITARVLRFMTSMLYSLEDMCSVILEAEVTTEEECVALGRYWWNASKY